MNNYYRKILERLNLFLSDKFAGFPGIFKEEVLILIQELKGKDRDIYAPKFLDKLLFSSHGKRTFYRDNLEIYEKLYFFIENQDIKSVYGKVLFNKYLSLLDKDPKRFIKKIEALLKNKGLSFEDLHEMTKKRILSKLRKETLITYFSFASRYKKQKKKK